MGKIYPHVCGGRKREDLARELIEKYSGKYVLVDGRGETYVEDALRNGEPQADVFNDKKYAEMVASQHNNGAANLPHGRTLTPVRISKSSLDKLVKDAEKKGHEPLMRGARGATAIIGLLGGIFFLSSNFTGNVIGLNQSSGNIVGVVLLIIGLVGSFFWFRKKN